MAAKKSQNQGQANTQPKQTLIALKPFKKVEDTPPVPVPEVAKAPEAEAPVVPKSSLNSVGTGKLTKKIDSRVALKTVAPPAQDSAGDLEPKLNRKPKQGQAKAQPKQTLIALKPFKKVEDAPPVPVPEVAKAPEAEAPVVPKPSLHSVGTGKLTKKIDATVALNAVAPPADDPPAGDLEPTLNQKPMFQAIGVLVGQVKFSEDQGTVVIKGKEYSLLCASYKRKVYDDLQKQIEATGRQQWRLVVYPTITHFPTRGEPYRVSFQLVSFDNGRVFEGTSQELRDFEFRLCGLWRFIPVCPIPCISVFKNFSQERLTYIKPLEADLKVKFLKASHIPLIWRGDIKPFRFNPKLTASEQGHPTFVSVLATFQPERNVFEFSKLLASPQDQAPNFLKAGKKDKADAMQLKMQQQHSNQAAMNKID